MCLPKERPFRNSTTVQADQPCNKPGGSQVSSVPEASLQTPIRGEVRLAQVARHPATRVSGLQYRSQPPTVILDLRAA